MIHGCFFKTQCVRQDPDDEPADMLVVMTRTGSPRPWVVGCLCCACSREVRRSPTAYNIGGIGLIQHREQLARYIQPVVSGVEQDRLVCIERACVRCKAPRSEAPDYEGDVCPACIANTTAERPTPSSAHGTFKQEALARMAQDDTNCHPHSWHRGERMRTVHAPQSYVAPDHPKFSSHHTPSVYEPQFAPLCRMFGSNPQEKTMPEIVNNTGRPSAAIVETLKTDATDAAWRTAGSQFVKLARDPLAAALCRHLGPDDPAFRARVATFLQTELGASILSAVLSAGLTALPQTAGPVPERLARELRVRAMSGVGDTLADVLMGPLREVASLYLRGEVPGTAPVGELMPRHASQLADALHGGAHDEATPGNVVDPQTRSPR